MHLFKSSRTNANIVYERTNEQTNERTNFPLHLTGRTTSACASLPAAEDRGVVVGGPSSLGLAGAAGNEGPRAVGARGRARGAHIGGGVGTRVGEQHPT